VALILSAAMAPSPPAILVLSAKALLPFLPTRRVFFGPMLSTTDVDEGWCLLEMLLSVFILSARDPSRL